MVSRPTLTPPGNPTRAGVRTYPDPCGVARALNLVGERWALLVVRELLLGPKRFTDLRAGLPAISPNVLSQRLEELTGRGLVDRRDLGPPVSGAVYELTPFGVTLEPVLIALAFWGSRTLPPGRDGELSADALVLALRTTLRPDPGSSPVTVLLLLGGDEICVSLGPHTMSAARVIGTSGEGLTAAAPATITTDAATLRSVVFAGLPVRDARADGRLRISGDARVARRFLTRFERPALLASPHATDPPNSTRAWTSPARTLHSRGGGGR